MKASVSKKYGTPEVFEMEDVTKPVPKHNEVLVRVYATTVTGSDLMMRNGNSTKVQLAQNGCWHFVILLVGNIKKIFSFRFI